MSGGGRFRHGRTCVKTWLLDGGILLVLWVFFGSFWSITKLGLLHNGLNFFLGSIVGEQTILWENKRWLEGHCWHGILEIAPCSYTPCIQHVYLSFMVFTRCSWLYLVKIARAIEISTFQVLKCVFAHSLLYLVKTWWGLLSKNNMFE